MQLYQTATPHVPIHSREWRVRLAWGLCGGVLVLGVALVLLSLQVPRNDFRQFIGITYFLTTACTGAFIITRRPTNTIGWLLLVAGVFLVLGALVVQYGLYDAFVQPGVLPFARPIAWLATICTPVGTCLLVLGLPLLFPNGQLLSPSWRPISGVMVVILVLMSAYFATRPGNIQQTDGLPNPFVVALPPFWNGIADYVVNMCFWGLLFASVSSIILRYRRTIGDERLQLKWLMYVVIAWVVAAMFSTLVEKLNATLFVFADALVLLALLLIPLSIGMAVLRYRLYDIDLLINRTLVYGLLTTGAVGVYALVVVGLGSLLQVQGSPIISLLATGLIAVLFQPLRVRLQNGINRLLYGDRDEPYIALTRLGQRLQATLAPDAVLPTLVQTVAEALRLPYVAITLDNEHGNTVASKRNGHRAPTIAAAYGVPPAVDSSHQLTVLPLTYQGEPIAQLLLAPRRGAGFTAADHQLLNELARQAGAAVQAAQLTLALQARMDDVRRSRERLVIAQEEERRRIQRDLHDGLGPVLASMRLRLEACLDRATAESSTLIGELEQLDLLVGQASSDIRRLVYNLRPPALDQLGLATALRQHTSRFHRETGITVEMHAAPDLPLTAATEVTLYRIVHEALNNIHKHASATHVTVRIEPVGAALLLHIRDDGVGGAVEGATDDGGTGLGSMRERAELLGGTLVLRSEAGAGTILDIYLPLRGENDE